MFPSAYAALQHYQKLYSISLLAHYKIITIIIIITILKSHWAYMLLLLWLMLFLIFEQKILTITK